MSSKLLFCGRDFSIEATSYFGVRISAVESLAFLCQADKQRRRLPLRALVGHFQLTHMHEVGHYLDDRLRYFENFRQIFKRRVGGELIDYRRHVFHAQVETLEARRLSHCRCPLGSRLIPPNRVIASWMLQKDGHVTAGGPMLSKKSRPSSRATQAVGLRHTSSVPLDSSYRP